jgi:hypothetical protein
MLLITVEIWPGGRRDTRRTVASMAIGNLSSLAAISDYQIDARESANPLTAAPARSASCKVVGHDRRSSVWALVAKAATEIQQAESGEG